MEDHVQRLGKLSIVYGALGGLVALALLVIEGGPGGLYSYFDDQMLGIIVSTVAVLLVITAIPSVVGGIFLLRYRSWARVVLIVSSALSVLTVPFGTLIGAYGLWVLLSPEIEPLLNDTPPSLSHGYGKPTHRPGRRSLASTAGHEVGAPRERFTDH